jgi:hypothetical protein
LIALFELSRLCQVVVEVEVHRGQEFRLKLPSEFRIRE